MSEQQPLRQMAAQHSYTQLLDMLVTQGLAAEAHFPFTASMAGLPKHFWCGAVVDSHEAAADVLFVARKGKQHDGHSYVRAAYEQGCRSFLVSEQWYLAQHNAGFPALQHVKGEDHPEPNCCFVTLASSTEEALFAWASAYRQTLQHLFVVAISGSYGKTSTKELLGAMLAQRFCCQITPGNRNAPVGSALTIIGLSPQTEVAVLELGIDHPGEMDLLCSMAQPNLSLLTGIGSAHLGGFGSRSELARQKARIYKHLRRPPAKLFTSWNKERKQGLALLPADDTFLEILQQELEPNTLMQLYSAKLAAECGYQVKDCGLQGLRFSYGRATSPIQQNQLAPKATASLNSENTKPLEMEEQLSSRILLRGLHTQQVFWAAEAAARALGLTPEQILSGAQNYQPLFGRGELLQCQLKTTHSIKLLQDCYNASPESLYALIQMLQAWWEKALLPPCVLVLGDMLELGQASQKSHEQVASLLETLFQSCSTSQYPKLAVLLYGQEMRHAWTKLLALEQNPCQLKHFYCLHLSNGGELAYAMQKQLLRLGESGPDGETPLLILKGANEMHLEKIAQKILL